MAPHTRARHGKGGGEDTVIAKLPRLTAKDREEMAIEKKRNSEQRMEFVTYYAAWLKKTTQQDMGQIARQIFGEKMRIRLTVPLRIQRVLL